MKVDIIRKFKWYIVGFILVVIMLSVGLSFCTWDDLSINKALSTGKTGKFYNERLYELAEDKYSDDNFTKGSNNIANIGDIVTFGSYYQEAPQINGEQTVLPDKTSLRWIVVEKQGTTLTLLADSVVAFGSFWGTYYYNSGNRWGQGTPNNGNYYQNYSQSTVRAWLNSQQRTDVNSDNANAAFSTTDANPMFRGFMQEAFSAEEQAYILPKTISGMYGSKKDAESNAVNAKYCENYATVTDKVWLPSHSEVYGKGTIEYWNGKNDGTPNTKFSYFADDNVAKRKATTTAFARSSASNYTWKDATGASNSQSEESVWWWLRSPHPSDSHYALTVGSSGTYSIDNTNNSRGGVRPAVCVPL